MEIPLERAVMEKKPVPEIDFTLHTMEDNTTVSTQERVCKGMDTPRDCIVDILLTSIRCSSTCYATADRPTVLVAT
jgi:hypothetical protein